MNTITRKIQLIIPDNYKENYRKLLDWNEIVFRSYNYVSTHLYIQENIREFFYMNDELKINLSHKIGKNGEEPLLKTSKQNTTYQLLSSKFKGDIPSSILTCLNQNVKKNFSSESKEYFSGKRSLRTYKRDTPIPFSASDILDVSLADDGKNYDFSLYKINFKTNFGRDLSDNQTIFKRGLVSKEYKFCNSSIQLSKGKIFLLAVFQFESEELKLNEKKTASVALDLLTPIKVSIGKKEISIGTKEEYLHRRLAIKRKLKTLQKAIKFNEGGNGRIKKLKAIEKYKKLEKDYIKNRLHNYSRELINICVKYKIGNICFEDQSDEMKNLEDRIKEIKANENLSYSEKNNLIEKHKFVIANWSYFGLNNFIKYKADKVGIKITN